MDADERYSYEAAGRVGAHYMAEVDKLKAQAKRMAMDSPDAKRQGKLIERAESWAKSCRSNRAIKAMLDLASKKVEIILPTEALDRDPYLLGVQNGVVDLRTGELRQAAREDFVTKRASVSYDPTAKAPLWGKFIKEITGAPIAAERDTKGKVIPATVGRFRPRPELATYLKRTLGYMLTGSSAEQKIFFAVGEGSNGKNAALDVVQDVLSDYATPLSAKFITASNSDTHVDAPTPTASSLEGKRLAIIDEIKNGKKLDVEQVKRFTGGGDTTIRDPFGKKNRRLKQTYKILVLTNHTPTLDYSDEAIRGRLHFIPFDRTWNRPAHPEPDPTLPDGDKDLPEKLRNEREGILAWMVRGAVEYKTQGLLPPEEVIGMTRNYLKDQDPVGKWLAGYRKCDPKFGISAGALYADFQRWQVDGGESTVSLSQKAFSMALVKRGVDKRDTKDAIKYGLKAKEVEGGG